MPDISMCQNNECAQNAKCYRFLAKPHEYRQAYADFKPDENGICDKFYEIFMGD